MISVKGIHKYFYRHKKNEIHVLNDMTIDFPDTGLVVLLGASGSGKTTLLNVIGGLDNIQQGTIEFDNESLKIMISKPGINSEMNLLDMFFKITIYFLNCLFLIILDSF